MKYRLSLQFDTIPKKHLHDMGGMKRYKLDCVYFLLVSVAANRLQTSFIRKGVRCNLRNPQINSLISKHSFFKYSDVDVELHRSNS